MTAKSKNSDPPEIKYMNRTGIIALAVYFILLSFLLVQNIVTIWPNSTQPMNKRVFNVAKDDTLTKDTVKLIQSDSTYMPQEALSYHVFFYSNPSPKPISLELRYIILVFLIGALGSCLHAISSFVDFVGNRNFIMSWLAWYILRPAIGGILAFLFYMALRAGLLPTNQSYEIPISPYSVAAFAGLAGLFTQRATIKLGEIFDVIFSSTTNYKDALNKKLRLIKITPENLTVGDTTTMVSIEGEDFSNTSKVLINGQVRGFTLQSNTILAIQLLADDVKAAGELTVTVENTGGEKSNALVLKIVAAVLDEG